MGIDRWLWLYRPTAPSARAQSVQVVNMAHAVSARGVEVTLLVEPPPGSPPDPGAILDWYGLPPEPALRLRVLPAGRTLGSLAYRAEILRFLASGGVVYARSPRRLAGVPPPLTRRLTVIFEAHCAESDPTARRYESAAVARAAGVVTNSEGTLAALRERYRALPRAIVAHNGTHPDRAIPWRGGGPVVCAGSARTYKDSATLADAARLLDEPIHLVGVDPADPEVAALVARSGGRLVARPPVPYRAVPALLAEASAAILPLSSGDFGEAFTSPLKLWDALAVGVPLVVADTAATRIAAPEVTNRYLPGDARALAAAITRAKRAPAPVPRCRTWGQRADELLAFVRDLA